MDEANMIVSISFSSQKYLIVILKISQYEKNIPQE